MPARNVIGVHHITVDLNIGDAVRAAAMVCAPKVHPRLERAKGPAVKNDAGLPDPQPAIFFHAGLERDDSRVPWVAGHKLLDVVHHHFNWSP